MSWQHRDILHSSRKRLHYGRRVGILASCSAPPGASTLLQNLLLWWNLKRSPQGLRFFLCCFHGCESSVESRHSHQSPNTAAQHYWRPAALENHPAECAGGPPWQRGFSGVSNPGSLATRGGGKTRHAGGLQIVCYTAVHRRRDSALALRAAAGHENAEAAACLRSTGRERGQTRLADIDFGQGRLACGCIDLGRTSRVR
jgi:hypothetical protein